MHFIYFKYILYYIYIYYNYIFSSKTIVLGISWSLDLPEIVIFVVFFFAREH